MKKLFALLLALTLALSLAACGEKDNGGNSTGDNSTQGNSSTSGGTSTASQGDNDTNKNDIWTDTDAQTVSVDKKYGHYDFTVWDEKNTTEVVVHPGSSKHKITTTGYTEELYAPFKVIYTNTNDVELDATCAMYVLGGKDANAIIYIALEGASEYRSSNDTTGPDVGAIKPGETVTVVGYFELSKLSNKTSVAFTKASIVVEFTSNSRPVIDA